jgi:hypothetical protein
MIFDILGFVDTRWVNMRVLGKSSRPPIVCCAPLAAPTLDESEATATAELFKALGDPARVRIVNALASAVPTFAGLTYRGIGDAGSMVKA